MCFLGLVSGAAARGEKRTWSQWCHTRSARSSLPINFFNYGIVQKVMGFVNAFLYGYSQIGIPKIKR